MHFIGCLKSFFFNFMTIKMARTCDVNVVVKQLARQLLPITF